MRDESDIDFILRVFISCSWKGDLDEERQTPNFQKENINPPSMEKERREVYDYLSHHLTQHERFVFELTQIFAFANFTYPKKIKKNLPQTP